MKYTIAAATLLAATVSADNGCYEDSIGNWYCQEVTAISYTNVGKLDGSLQYNKVTNMWEDGTCIHTPQSYSGPISPLNEEVSMHFRGPLTLKQFAFYTPSTSGNSRRSTHERRRAHGHGHAHLHHKREASPVEEKRQVGAWVTQVMGDKTVSWQNNYSGQETAAPAAAGDDWVFDVMNGVTVSWINNWNGEGTAAPAPAAAATSAPAVAPAASSAASAAPSVNAASAAASWNSDGTPSGGWTRQAYYDSASGTADGLVFLNHNGGQGSGVWDKVYGNSLSYATSDGCAGSASPQVLADTTLTSADEIVIMSDKQCSGQDGDCGYFRNGTVAYHGFGGANKAFYFEFGMPNDGQYTSDPYKPVNMPAIWLLNAQIPRTLQYGSCSCWDTGCGEFDIFEVLDPGDGKCKSTLHGNIQGGDSNYFARPFVGTMKAVLIMTDNDFHIKVLDSSSAFGADLIENTLSSIISDTMSAIAGVSLFPLSS